jgi:hypothetical protein
MNKQTWQKICNTICYWAPITIAILAIAAIIFPVAFSKLVFLPLIICIAIITFLASTIYDNLQKSMEGLLSLAEKISPEVKESINKVIKWMKEADPTPAQ